MPLADHQALHILSIKYHSVDLQLFPWKPLMGYHKLLNIHKPRLVGCCCDVEGYTYNVMEALHAKHHC